MPDTKIFIDTDEEIVFIVDKIRQANTRNVVLIAPDRASIFITSASLKLLQKAIDRLDKRVILVTMDEAGKRMADEVGMVTVNRVREVLPEYWDKVSQLKLGRSKVANQQHQSTISKPHVEVVPVEEVSVEDSSENKRVIPNLSEFEFRHPKEDIPVEPENESLKHDTNDSIDEVQNIQSNENSDDSVGGIALAEPEIITPSIEEVVVQPEDTNISQYSPVPEKKVEYLKSDDEIEVEKLYDNYLENHIYQDQESITPIQAEIIEPKKEFKIPNFKKEKVNETVPDTIREYDRSKDLAGDDENEIEVDDDALEFVFGGDIADNKIATPPTVKKKSRFLENNDIPQDEEGLEDPALHKSSRDTKATAGRIWDIVKAKSIIVWGFIIAYISKFVTFVTAFAKSKFGKNKRSTGSRLETRPSNRRTVDRRPMEKKSKKLLYIVGAVVLLFLSIFWWFTYHYAPSIRITADLQTKSVTKQQDITAKFGASEGIQAFTKSETASSSDSISTTGTKKKGTPATGAVTANYLQVSGTITIKAGTELTCLSAVDCGGQALKFVTVEDKTVSFSTPAIINIQAADIGPEYNIKALTKFKFKGISEGDMIISNGKAFAGGASQDVRSVSQNDITELQTRLTNTLKSSASSKITSSLGANVVILQDKIAVQVKSVKTDKKVDEEADTLNMDMEISITAFGYDRTTVRPVVEGLLKQEEKDNLALDLNSIDIKDTVKASDQTGITISLNVSGKLKVKADKDKIANELLGKSLDEIKPYFQKIPNITNVNYVYDPSWAPGFLKHVPFGRGQVTIELKETN